MKEKLIEIAVHSFAATFAESGLKSNNDVEAMSLLLDRIVFTEEVGLDVFGIREHHRQVLLFGARDYPGLSTARTKRTHSPAPSLCSAQPIRCGSSKNLPRSDLISKGRAKMVVLRGSSIEAFPLFGFDLKDYDALFAEELALRRLHNAVRRTWAHLQIQGSSTSLRTR